ncbi:MAG: D-alanyl-D-alanine carboxypeptidase [Phycisphaerales bacterium]
MPNAQIPVRRGGRAPLLIAAAGLGLLVAPPAAIAQELNARVEALIAGSKLGGAGVGVSILDLSSGRTLADHRGEAALIPASNMKLLTTGAALLVLGEEFVFRTELLVDGDRLIVMGSGDPALADPVILEQMTPRMSVEGLVEALAGAVRQAGVERIGQVIVDDRIFDREYVHPSWPADQLDKHYCAQVAGLNFHTNVLYAFPSPSGEGAGRPPTIALEPFAPWLEIQNRARTVAEGRNSVWLSRERGTNRFTLMGEVRFPAKVPIDITLHEVPLLVGQLIAAELPRSGVAVGPVPAKADRARLGRDELQSVLPLVRLAEPGESLSGRSVAAVTTHIRDVLERCNNDSQNLYAEALLKRLGHDVTGEPGSWTNGASVVRMTIKERLGAEYAASTVVADGSGMSREDKVAPRTLTRWLETLQKDPRFGEAFVDSLATPGDGTLRSRFGEAKLRTVLRAKSGKIDRVRCLSGYLTDPASGRRVAFSVMVNGFEERDFPQALKLHEDVVVLIDRWLAAGSKGSTRVGQVQPASQPAKRGSPRSEPVRAGAQGR